MTTTPTAALVEEAEKLSTQATPGPWCHNRYGVNNWPGPDAPTHLMELLHNDDKDDEQNDRDAEFIARARTLVPELAAALRRAKTARDAAIKQSAGWEIQAQDLRDRLVKAEAERDAQHALVLRLTAERDEARARIDRILDPPIKRMNMADGEINVVLDAPEMARIIATTFWDCLEEHKAKNYVEMSFARPESPMKRVVVTVRKLIGRTPEELREEVAKERDLLLTENARLQQQLSRPDPVVHETPVDGVVPCCGKKLHDLKDGSRVNEGPLVNCDRMRLLSRVGELSSENLLLNEENARLQKEVATLELLRRGGR